MGLWSTIKGWLNIGGVKVRLEGVDSVVRKDGTNIKGKVLLTTKDEKTVLKMTYKFILERSTGRGEEKKTEETVIAKRVLNDSFDIKAGETKEIDFNLDYAMGAELKDKGGVLGGVGKLAAFATAEKDEYFVVAEADVKGAALDPSAKVNVTVQ